MEPSLISPFLDSPRGDLEFAALVDRAGKNLATQRAQLALRLAQRGTVSGPTPDSDSP